MPGWLKGLALPVYAPDGEGGGQGAGSGDGGGEGGAGDGGGKGGGSMLPGAGGDGGDGDRGSLDWRSSLDADARQVIDAEKIGDLNTLVRNYSGLQQKIGARGLIPPGKDAKPEDWEGWDGWSALGRPEAADKYDLGDFKPDERTGWQPEVQGRVLEAGHKAGLTNAQAHAVLTAYHDAAVEAVEAQEKANDEAFKAADTTLRREWGAAYDARLEGANMALSKLGGQELVDLLAEKGLGNDPRMVKAFAQAAELLGEDQLRGEGGGVGNIRTPAEAKAEIGRLKADSDFQKVMTNSSHPEYPDAVKRLQALHALAGQGE